MSLSSIANRVHHTRRQLIQSLHEREMSEESVFAVSFAIRADGNIATAGAGDLAPDQARELVAKMRETIQRFEAIARGEDPRERSNFSDNVLPIKR